MGALPTYLSIVNKGIQAKLRRHLGSHSKSHQTSVSHEWDGAADATLYAVVEGRSDAFTRVLR